MSINDFWAAYKTFWPASEIRAETEEEQQARMQRLMADVANVYPAAVEQAKTIAANFRTVPLETLRRVVALLEQVVPGQYEGHRAVHAELAALKAELEGLVGK